MSDPFDLTATPVHLGLGATAEPLRGFSWDPSSLALYAERTASDGDEGRLVTMFSFDAPWDQWEQHPHGSELVICTSGRASLIQEVDGEQRTVEVSAGEAVINPPGVWHTVDVDGPTTMVFMTSGRGTRHRPR